MSRRIFLQIAVLVSVALAVAASVATAVEPKASDPIDLKLTAELVRSWGSRPSFPESVTFAYYNAYSGRALGKEIGPELKRRIVDYVARCQQDDGGFTAEPTYSKKPNVIFTYYGLKTLAMLGALERIDRKNAEHFLRSLEREAGGMAAADKPGEKATLAATYHGIEALHLLGALDRLDKKKTAAFVRRYQVKDKGFSMVEGGGSSPQATHMAVRTLERLGALTAELRAEVITYLKATRYSGLVEAKMYRTLPQMAAMASTLEALALLGAVDQIDAAKAYKFVASLYVPLNGGFGPRPGLGTTPPSTYQAILCLVRLGKLRDPPAIAGAKPQVPSPPEAAPPSP
jgi:geranylgeranyl transferase type-2 subunit beta